MAVRTSATSGLYGAGATWVGGVAPVEGDSVVIARTGTALETFSTDAAGYAIGATALTLTGAVAAGSYVIGEAVQFPGDNTYYTITNWNSGTKVLTIDPLVVAIPASATVVKSRGHVVTVDGTYVAGDDTTTAFTVNGTLRASRITNSSLTVKGQLLTASSIAATIDYGRRSLSDPIPAGITAKLILNKSASMASYKYGLFVAEASNCYFCGVTRTVNTTLTGDMAVAATSATVADITGWAVGDLVVFAASDGTSTHFESRVLTSVTPGTGTAGTIGWTSGASYAHGTACPVGNMSSNVTVSNYDTATYTFVCLRHTTTASNNRREVDYTNFRYAGSNSANTTTQSFVTGGNTTLVTPLVTFTNSSFYNCNGTNTLFLFVWNSGGFTISGLGFFTDNGSGGQQVYMGGGTYLKVSDCVFYYGGNGYNSTQSQGGQGCVLTNCTFCSTGSGTTLLNQSNGDGLQVINCKFHTATSGQALISIQSGTAAFTTCSFGSSDLWGTPSFGYVASASQGGVLAQKFEGIMTDCKFGTPGTGFYVNLANANPTCAMYVSNKNLDPSVQEIYTPVGTIVRDNTSKISGVTSLKMSPTSSTTALTFVLYVPAPTGNKIGVSGYLWRDTANTTTVTLSGLGITTSTYTASGSLSANEQFFVSGTQTTGTDGMLTLTFSTIGTSGNLWIDSISAPQAASIDFGQFGYWANALPADIITANTVSAGDVWNYLAANVTLSGSMGRKVKTTFVNTI